MSDLVLEWMDACMKVFGADEGDFGLMNEDSIIKAEKQYRSLIKAKEKAEAERDRYEIALNEIAFNHDCDPRAEAREALELTPARK